MKSTLTAGCLFLLVSALTGIAMGIWLSGYMDLDSEFTGPRAVLNKVLYFKYYIAEMIVVLILFVLSSGRGVATSLIRLVVVPIIFVVWILQFLAFWFSGEFVSLLVLENSRAAATVLSWNSIAIVLMFCAAGSGLYVVVKWIAGCVSRRLSRTLAVVLGLALCFGLFIADNNLGGQRKAEMREVARSMVNGRNPPFYSFARLVSDFRSPAEYLEHEAYSYSDHLRAQKLDLRVKWDSDFPMVHEQYYSKPLPFSRRKPNAKPNVIVFFVESLSARKLESYGSIISGVTPELEKFAVGSLLVDNYYGHTQSTFRGLRGQLCSMFPYHTSRKDQWADVNFKFPETIYNCLPHHLGDNGYDTIFMGPDDADHMHFRSQTTSMGFRQNLYRHDINEKYLAEVRISGRFLTDAQMANGVGGFVQDPNLQQPFFLSAYFKGAHLGLNSHSDGKIFGDGSNRVLNTLHTFDAAFAQFWNNFSTSSLVYNTIVIITGDHSHWPEKAFMKVAGEDFNRTPIDRVALMIYSPFHEFPERYDAKNATSLGFAPMLTQLLDLPHATNSFIGISPFERENVKTSFAWFNDRIYIINEDNSVDYYNIRRDKLPALASAGWKAVKQTHIAEFKNRIVNE